MTRYLAIVLTTLVLLGVAVALGGEHRMSLVIGVLALFGITTTWGSLSVRAGVMVRGQCRLDDRTDVLLSFDDGPDPEATPPLLELLAAKRVRAAFFLIGEQVRAHPEIARRIHEAGHLIGNHSEHHSPWTNFYNPGRLRHEISAAQASIEAATGMSPVHYRPPYGLLNHAVEPALRKLGLTLFGWRVRSYDTMGGDVDRVVRRVLRRVRGGDIVLLHDGNQPAERVLAIVDRLVDALRAEGYDLRPQL